jgi:hypothetical protein
MNPNHSLLTYLIISFIIIFPYISSFPRGLFLSGFAVSISCASPVSFVHAASFDLRSSGNREVVFSMGSSAVYVLLFTSHLPSAEEIITQ